MKRVEAPNYEDWFRELDGNKPVLVAFTGAGISAESGVRTFRDNDGLWEEHRVEDVAHINAWRRNPELVLRFYNARRAQLGTVEPNAAHIALAELKDAFHVVVVTQNVDNLHERAGSDRVLHLHGELTKVRSESVSDLIYDIGSAAIELGDTCEQGFQLRPHIVWFGEDVPLYEVGMRLCQLADYALVIGTSMVVSPACWLVEEFPTEAPTWYINPDPTGAASIRDLKIVPEKAGVGVPLVAAELRQRWLNTSQ
jgi:NAD-dependent deacetylase